MLIKILFWVLVLCDLGAIGLVYLLGLAAAGPSKSSPVTVTLYLLVMPAAVLAVAVVLFLFGKSPAWRGAALLVAAAPLLFLVGTQISGEMTRRAHTGEDGNITRFAKGPMQDVEFAITRNDPAGVARAARGASLNQQAIDRTTVLVFALRQLEKHPGPPDVLKALLDAGADPNAPGDTLPLQTAIYATTKTGMEPVTMLLKAGANPNQPNGFGEPAYFAATGYSVAPEVMELLIGHGADLTARARDGNSALFRAAATENWKVALVLLRRGVDWRQAGRPGGPDLQRMVEQSAGFMANGKKGDAEGLAEVQRFLAQPGR
jgi:ankyrin repeat protein